MIANADVVDPAAIEQRNIAHRVGGTPFAYISHSASILTGCWFGERRCMTGLRQLTPSRCDRRREFHVLVDQNQRERRRIGTLALEAAARAEVLDQAIEDALEHQVFPVVAPRAPLLRVGEAVRLPRDREADLIPAVAPDDHLAVVHEPAAVVPL